jgi:hypothetical protein
MMGPRNEAPDHASPRNFGQAAAAAGKPAPGPGQGASCDIVSDIGFKIHDFGTFNDTISESDPKMTRYRICADVGILRYYTDSDIGAYPISESDINDIGEHPSPISGKHDI